MSVLCAHWVTNVFSCREQNVPCAWKTTERIIIQHVICQVIDWGKEIELKYIQFQ